MLTNIREILNGAVERSLVRLWSGRLTRAEAVAMRSRAATAAKYRKARLETPDALAALEQLLPIEVTERHDRIVITGSPGKAPARAAGS